MKGFVFILSLLLYVQVVSGHWMEWNLKNFAFVTILGVFILYGLKKD